MKDHNYLKTSAFQVKTCAWHQLSPLFDDDYVDFEK